MVNFQFMDSALKAGYPYVLEIEVKVAGEVDYVYYKSYKDCVLAWRDASRLLGQAFNAYEYDEHAMAFAQIWRVSGDLLFNKHDLICTIGAFDKGSARNVVRDGEVWRIR